MLISAAIGAIVGLRISTMFDSSIVGILAAGSICVLIVAIGSHFAREELIPLFKIFFNRHDKDIEELAR